jgi:hypothetical protein
MALPKLDVTTFKVTLPSNEQKILCRPFLVKEEKILLIAKEGKDDGESVHALRQVIGNCILDDGVDISKLPLIDIEYLLLKIRAQSMGSIITTTYRHGDCKKPTEVDVDLDKVKVVINPKNETKLQITKDIGVVMKYPTIDLMTDLSEAAKDNTKVFDLLLKCIDNVYDEENVYSSSDYTQDELNEFVMGMTKKQFEKIEEFFTTLPKLQQEINFKCVECDYTEKIVLEGLASFFD